VPIFTLVSTTTSVHDPVLNLQSVPRHWHLLIRMRVLAPHNKQPVMMPMVEREEED
jgi:hypothetical protein